VRLTGLASDVLTVCLFGFAAVVRCFRLLDSEAKLGSAQGEVHTGGGPDRAGLPLVA
jgi:hypothetical protein